MSNENTSINVTLNGRNNTRSAFAAVSKDITKMRTETDSLSKSWSTVSRVMTAAIAGVSVGGVFSKFITETQDAQREQGQLSAVLRSTGESAGWTQDRLNEMADAMSASSTFSSGEINQAQARLLSYTNVVGEEFPQAMQAAIDMATRLGMDITSASETVGRALDIPSQGLSALSRQGFRFTEEQKNLIKSLEETGQTAQAQAILLDALEASYGGAAKAARDDFGGALTALGNRLNDLMTGGEGSLVASTAAINTLTDALGGADAQRKFDHATSGLNSILTTLSELASKDVYSLMIVPEFSTGWIDAITNLGMSKNPFASWEESISGAEKQLQAVIKDKEKLSDRGWDTSASEKEIESLERRVAYYKQMKAYEDQIAKAQENAALDQQNSMLRNNYRGRSGERSSSSQVATSTAPTGNLGEQEKLRSQYASESQKMQAELDRASKAFAGTIPEDLEAQIRARYGKAGRAAAESWADAIEEASLAMGDGLTPEMLDMVNTTQKTSGTSAATEQLKQLQDSYKLEQEFQALLAQSESSQTYRAVDNVAQMEAENNQMRENIEQIGLNADGLRELEQRRIDDAIATKEQALAQAQSTGASELEMDSIREQIRLLQERKGLVDETYTREQTTGQSEGSSEFTKQAARNIQNTFGDTIEDGLKNNCDEIDDAWKNLLINMTAQAAAAKVTEALFGNWTSTGEIGGLIGTGITWVSTSLSGNRAGGGGVSAGNLYEVSEVGPELLSSGGRTYLMMGSDDGYVTPASSAASQGIAVGGTPNVNVNLSGVSSAPSTTASMGSDGSLNIDMVFSQFERRAGQNIAQGSSPILSGIKNRLEVRERV